MILLFPTFMMGNKYEHSFKINKIAELPPVDFQDQNPGVAGVFSGIIGNKLIVAGGANFPDKKPWEGGIKTFHDRINIYTINNESLNLVNGHWSLPKSLAYGTSVTLPEGVLIAGGNDQEQCSRSVYLLKWDEAKNDLIVETFPELPVPLSYTSAVLLDKSVYLIGGSSSPDAQGSPAYFMKLDLTKRNNANFSWEALPPFPGLGRVFAVASVQSNGVRPCIFLFSGRNVSMENELTVFQDGLFYDPVLQKWETLPSSIKFPVMAGTSFPIGASSIAFAGGTSGDLLFKELELKQLLSNSIDTRDTFLISQSKMALVNYFTQHPGFSKNILVYNTITKTIAETGKFEQFCPVTTSAVPYKKGVIITSGEIKPGIRTPDIIRISPVSHSYSFGWVNSTVLFLYFIVLVAVGYIVSKKQKTTDDYFKGGGRIPWWAAGLSLFGTALSAITFMAVPAKTYATDWSYFLFNMTIFLVAPVIILLFIPFYRKLNVTTAYEYLEKRFNLTIRLLGSISFILFQIGRMGVILLLPSLALNVVTGMDVFLCIGLMGIVSLGYTMMGGIEAVIWTDVIQVVILLTGAFVALFIMIGAIDGGISMVYQTAAENHKFNLFDLSLSLREPTVWVMIIGGLFTNITTYGTDQTMVQRYLTTQTEKQARQSVWTNAWLTIPATLLFFSIGTVLFVFYRQFPALGDPSLENIDSVFPWFIASQLPDGLSGLLIAGIFAAAMSSLSSSMNSAATAYSTDIHFRFNWGNGISELKTARIATLAVGLVGTLFALFMATWEIQSLWDEFNKLIGLIIGALGGVFFLGILTKKGNSKGALVGIAVSILVQIIVSQSGIVHLLLYTSTGFISCFVVGWLSSLFFRNKNENIAGLTIYDQKGKQ